MLYITKIGKVQLLEGVSAMYVLALRQLKSLVKLATKTQGQMSNAQEISPESSLILNHRTDLAPLGSHLFRHAD